MNIFWGLVNCNSVLVSKQQRTKKRKRGAIQAADVRLSDKTWDPVTASKTGLGAAAGRNQWGKRAEE